ncbi:hypothetical protein [Lysobacter capsici]|uniref:hypothetical protein n=1 Tax=Lysobacter capsici TaxID=435897 RepID=UPI0012FD0E51|nr:hypothetical protein [Lysobacter capsici]
MRTKAVDLVFGFKALELQSLKLQSLKLQSLKLQSFEAFKAVSRIKSVPPLKRRVTFFCLKQQKKGNQRKMLFYGSSARAIGADAGMRHTGHPVSVAHGADPCAPPYGCPLVLASQSPRIAG